MRLRAPELYAVHAPTARSYVKDPLVEAPQPLTLGYPSTIYHVCDGAQVRGRGRQGVGVGVGVGVGLGLGLGLGVRLGLGLGTARARVELA